MLKHADVYAAHQHARWMHPDAARCARPDAAKSLKRDSYPADVDPALADHRIALSNWSITIRVDVVGKEKEWPGMGIIIYSNEIIDELQRDFLPERFRDLIFGTIPPPPESAESIADKVRKLMKPRP